MANLKVLQIESWMKEDWIVEDSGYVPIKPIYNRDGYYMISMGGTKGCWFEVDGKAYVANAESFNWSMRILNVKPWTEKLWKAYNVLMNERLLDKKQMQEYYDQQHWLELRNIRRSVCLFMMKD